MRQRSAGTIVESRPGESSGGSLVGILFRGEYNAGRLYAKSDAVKISSGQAAGVYLRTTNQTATTEQPWMGGGWTQLSKLQDQWL